MFGELGRVLLGQEQELILILSALLKEKFQVSLRQWRRVLSLEVALLLPQQIFQTA
jgi:hypothetical protein